MKVATEFYTDRREDTSYSISSARGKDVPEHGSSLLTIISLVERVKKREMNFLWDGVALLDGQQGI